MLAGQDSPHDSVLHQHLQLLGGASGKRAPALYSLQVARCDLSADQLFAENISSRNRVLNGKIDAYSTDGRHGVRSIADAEQSRPPPLFEAIHLHRKQADIIPVAQLADAVAKERRQPHNVFAKLGDAALLDIVERTLGNDISALPIVLPVDHDKKYAGFGMAQTQRRISFPAADA